MKKLAMLLGVLLALCAQTPAAPARHLEYAFAIYPTARSNNGDYDGKLSVDVLGQAPDGGMLVRASEWWYFTLRPRQARECEIYAGGSVRCDNVPPYPSDVELTLFPLLAPDFFKSGSLTGASSWQQQFTLSLDKNLYVTQASMNLSATPQGSQLNVTSKGRFQQLDRSRRTIVEEGRFTYDRTLGIPIVVHDVHGPLPTASVYSQLSVDLQLMKDSAAAADAPAIEGLGPAHFRMHGSDFGFETNPLPTVMPGIDPQCGSWC